jgi:hypothetical protein
MDSSSMGGEMTQVEEPVLWLWWRDIVAVVACEKPRLLWSGCYGRGVCNAESQVCAKRVCF